MYEQQNAKLDLNCWSDDEYKIDIITDADILTDQKWPSHHMGIATIPGLYMLSQLVQACHTWKSILTEELKIAQLILHLRHTKEGMNTSHGAIHKLIWLDHITACFTKAETHQMKRVSVRWTE